MWTRQRNRSGKSYTDSKMFPYSVGAECGPCFREGLYWKELLRAQVHSSHRQAQEVRQLFGKQLHKIHAKDL